MLTLYLACVFFVTFFHKQFYAVKFSHCSLTIHLYILLNNVHHCRRSFYTFLHLLHDYQNVNIPKPKYILKLYNKFSFSVLEELGLGLCNKNFVYIIISLGCVFVAYITKMHFYSTHMYNGKLKGAAWRLSLSFCCCIARKTEDHDQNLCGF